MKIPEKLEQYILGKDSMPIFSDFSKKEIEYLRKMVLNSLGKKYITLYRGFSIACEPYEIGEVFLEENALVSFTESRPVAEEIAKERSLDGDLGVVVEIDLPTSVIFFHYSIDEVGDVFYKEKEVIAIPYSFEWRPVQYYKNGKKYKIK